MRIQPLRKIWMVCGFNKRWRHILYAGRQLPRRAECSTVYHTNCFATLFHLPLQFVTSYVFKYSSKRTMVTYVCVMNVIMLWGTLKCSRAAVFDDFLCAIKWPPIPRFTLIRQMRSISKHSEMLKKFVGICTNRVLAIYVSNSREKWLWGRMTDALRWVETWIYHYASFIICLQIMKVVDKMSTPF